MHVVIQQLKNLHLWCICTPCADVLHAFVLQRSGVLSCCSSHACICLAQTRGEDRCSDERAGDESNDQLVTFATFLFVNSQHAFWLRNCTLFALKSTAPSWQSEHHHDVVNIATKCEGDTLMNWGWYPTHSKVTGSCMSLASQQMLAPDLRSSQIQAFQAS